MSLKKLYSYHFFNNFMLIYPFYAVMFSDFGLDNFQISLLFLTWSLTTFVLEIPSGVLADMYSRKKLLLFAVFVKILAFSTWIFYPSFIGFIVGFILWGITSSFTSGTLDALVYDELKRERMEGNYKKVLGRLKAISYFSVLLASLFASQVIVLGYAFIIKISVISLLISWFSLLSLSEVKKVKDIEEENYSSLLKEGLVFSFKKRDVLSFLFVISIAGSIFGVLDEFWPLVFYSYGFQKQGLAIIEAVLMSAGMIGGLIAYKLKKRVFFYLMLSSVFVFLAGYFKSGFSVFSILGFVFFYEVLDVFFNDYFQKIIPSKNRATVSSVKNFFLEIMILINYVLFGFISKTFSISQSLYVFSIIIFASSFSYILIKKKFNLKI